MKFKAIELNERSNIEVIKQCGLELLNEGIVGNSFIESCIEREHHFPTGLPVDPPVAIPHTFDPSVKESSVCYARLKKPVTFKQMDTQVDDLAVEHVFCMALKDEHTYIDFLRKLILSIQSQNFIVQLSKCEPENLVDFLRENLSIH
ncbi:PTS sugar transporter subunit IIA [Enterococcus casseliflavus]|uniref:PTS sugar transporter subunit IIA n=1 Tax=Enterococcus casseliflavus TaxID=37734 RepID=UPI0039A5FCC3